MYKFRCDLRGHSSDVRCIAHYDEEVIITGSRDRTCRIWTSQDGFFEGGDILCGHSDFVSSLCIIPASSTYPDGLIATGSNDHSICLYTPKVTSVTFQLKSHNDTVCCLYPAVNSPCRLLSSSWDGTVIMWDLVQRSVVFKIPVTKTPVWSVIQLQCGTIISGSADKIIRAHSNSSGALLRSYYGHSDCIRSLYPISNTQFISCGNDGYVLKWNVENTSCDTAIDSVHHFLYSVTYQARDGLIAYCGERGAVYVNSKTGNDVILVPSTSVWSITILPDGDIAAACSDGVIRVYTRHPQRFADEFKMQAHQHEIQRSAALQYQEKKKDIFLPYLNDLSGPEILDTVGKVSNEICFVRNGFFAVMYSWSTDRWVELAKRKGTYHYDISKKKMHDGQAYDYLFPIDIDDNQQNLTLPLTLGDNLLEKIIMFIAKHKLSSHYSETIYNHVTNTIKDDFLKASILESTMIGMDDKDYYSSVNRFFPRAQYAFFEKANLDQIFGKLNELAKTLSCDISETTVQILKNVTSQKHNCCPEDCTTLVNLLTWPPEFLLPVLDLLRLAMRNESFHNYVLKKDDVCDKIKTALVYHLVDETYPVNQIVTLRVYCNMFSYNPGRKVIYEEFDNLISSLSCIKFPTNTSPLLQVNASSLIFNLTVYTERCPALRQKCLNCLSSLMDKFTDKEAYYRSLVALGNLISYEGIFFIPKSMIDLLKDLKTNKKLEGSQANDCLSDILLCLDDDEN